MAGGAKIASCTGAVVYVLAAVVTRPSVYTDAVVAAMCVVARPSILTCVGHQLAFVHIFCAVLT